MIWPVLAFLAAGLGPQDEPEGTRWLEDYDDARAISRVTGLPLVLYFSAVWCSACRSFEKRALRAPEVLELAEEFCWVHVEIDRNVTLARDYKVEGTPQLFVLGPDGAHLEEALGALDPAELRAFLDRARQRLAVVGTLEPSEVSRQDVPERTPLNWTPGGYRSRSICFSHVGYGPLHLPSQAPGQVLRLGFEPRAPSTLAEGQFEFGWSETGANVFSFKEDDYRLDYFTLNSVFSLAYGVTDTFLVELSYRDLSRFGSVLDPVTDAFHDVLGLGDSGRDQFDYYENIIDLELRDGVEIEDDSSGSESRNLALSLQHNLTCGTRRMPAIAYGIDAGYFLGGGADLDGHSRFSVGLSASLARRIGESFYAYLGLGHVWHGLDDYAGLPLEDQQWSGSAAVEWRHRSKSSWVLQYLVTDGVAENRDPFDDPSHEIDLGWKREIASGLVLELGLIENIIEVDNSPDFGLHFALHKRF